MDALLIKLRDTRVEDAPLLADFEACRQALGGVAAATGLYRAIRTSDVYVHCALLRPTDAADPDLAALRTELQRCLVSAAAPATIDRLQTAMDMPGASRSATPRFRYVVETDASDGWSDELDRWYDAEHMPGLARVPGCVRARRFLNRDAGPLSCACYDLVAPEVLESPAWLAVRGTPWSERVRPQFRNTRRTLFRTLRDQDEHGS